MNKVFSLTFVILLLVTSGCSSFYDKHVQWQRVTPESFPVIHAIGHAPISLQNSNNKTQKMLMAITASKAAAYVELAEQVYGQQISQDLTMADLIIKNQHLQSKVQGVIRGARVVKSYPTGDTYTTELSLDFKDLYDVYSVINVDKEIKEVNYY